jgi:capsule polysaccharide export protein KpsC/LpsZ
MLCRQAHGKGASILLKDMDVYKIYTPKMKINEHFLKVGQKTIDEAYKFSDLKCEKSYYQSRVLGLSEQIDVKNAYKNKKTYTKKESLELHSNFSEKKINVFVMAHAFSDAPHVGEDLLFKDYYDFLNKTLIELNKNSDVNCFVKAHPSSHMWGEKGGVEDILEKNKLNNVCILPPDYNTNSVIDIADVIVTAKGTAGLEFSCAGIPAITAGKGYYHGFGICHEPDSVDEYYTALRKIKGIRRLDDDKIRRALIVLYHSFNNIYHSDVLPQVQIRPGDNYQSMYRGKFSEMVTNLENGTPMKDDFYYMILSDIRSLQHEK